MLQNVEQNERRAKLKKYRGILLARISNNVLLHDHMTVNAHNPGELGESCDACREYLHDKQEFDMVGELLACNHEVVETNNGQVQKHYFYVVDDTEGNEYVVRAYNKDHALTLIEAQSEFELLPHPEQVSKKEAMDLVTQANGAAQTKLVTQYLRENEYYVGPVMSNLHGSMVSL